MSKRRRAANPYRKPDRFTVKAREQGFSARSVFKLEEVERRFRVLPRGGGRVVDLGCAPGSWSEYVATKGGGGATLVGLDIKEVANYPGVFLHQPIEAVPPDEIRALLGGPADLVLSDMAPHTTGARLTDHVRQLELAHLAFDAAVSLLKPGGHFAVKVFDGEDAPAFCERVKARFGRTRRVKPEATRGNSVEFFLLGLDFEG